jgi:hypothetical protein
VEGKDMKLLATAHQALFPDAESLQSTPNMSLGGWGGWQAAIGSSMLLQNTGGEHVSVYCIFDRDYHTPATIEKRRQEALANRVRLHIWTHKEIENFFLIPKPIVRSIKRRMPARAIAPTEGEISNKLDAICESLRDEVFDAIAADLLAENRGLGAGGANKAARQTLAENWHTLHDKLRTVSGKRAFGALSNWAEEQFGVTLNAVFVARECAAHELDPEMKMVLTAIEQNEGFGS